MMQKMMPMMMQMMAPSSNATNQPAATLPIGTETKAGTMPAVTTPPASSMEPMITPYSTTTNQPAATPPSGTDTNVGTTPAVTAPSAKSSESPSEHASHHPGSTDAAAAANPMAQMMAPSNAKPGPPGCCGLMETGGKPFYPSLMDFPTLNDKVRKYIRDEAIARLGSGAQIITAMQVDLHNALSANNAEAADAALKQVRLGLSLAESGASALVALNETQPPPQIALTWFKHQMNISSDTGMMMNSAFRDISWLHLFAMLMLALALMTAFIFRWLGGALWHSTQLVEVGLGCK